MRLHSVFWCLVSGSSGARSQESTTLTWNAAFSCILDRDVWFCMFWASYFKSCVLYISALSTIFQPSSSFVDTVFFLDFHHPVVLYTSCRMIFFCWNINQNEDLFHYFCQLYILVASDVALVQTDLKSLYSVNPSRLQESADFHTFWKINEDQ